MTVRHEWSLEPTQALFARFCALEQSAVSYFHFPAWWARISREVRENVGSYLWGRASKAERTELVIAHCDRVLQNRKIRVSVGSVHAKRREVPAEFHATNGLPSDRR